MRNRSTSSLDPLLARGGRFVKLKLPGQHLRECEGEPCACHKTPAHTGWQKRRPRRPELEEWQRQGGLLGLRPGSISALVIDVDAGDSDELLDHCIYLPEYITEYSTRRGRHIWLARDLAAPKPKWEGYGCSGDLLDGRRYAVLWGAAQDKLAAAVETKPRRPLRRQDPFAGLQLRLFTALGPPKDHGPPPPKGQGPPPGSGLEAIDEGGRNDALLTHTRWLARPLVDGAANWQQALEVTRQVALDANDRFPAPLPVGSKVEGLALGVARYLWHNKGFTAPHNQARRGHKSGQARRKATETRDSTIRLLRRLGYSMTEIASRTNVDKSTVSRVLRRSHQTMQEEVTE